LRECSRQTGESGHYEAHFINVIYTALSSMLPAILAAAFLIFIVGIYTLISAMGPIILLRPQRSTPQELKRAGKDAYPEDYSLPYELLSTRTSDGLTLRGWLISHNPNRGTVMYLHGVGDCKSQGLRVAKLLSDNGYQVVLMDSRAHGESDGDFCTYGYLERDDFRKVIDELERQGRMNGPLALMGISMGAAIALQTAALEPRVRGVISEASFVDLKTALLEYQYQYVRLRSRLLRWIVIRRAEQVGRFSVEEVSPVRAVKQIRVPLLFIHGLEDRRVAHEESEQLFANCECPKELFLVPGAHHTDVWKVVGKKYEEKLLGFLERLSDHA